MLFAHRLANESGTIPMVLEDIDRILAGLYEVVPKEQSDQLSCRLKDLKSDVNHLLGLAKILNQSHELTEPESLEISPILAKSIEVCQSLHNKIRIEVVPEIKDTAKQVMGVETILIDIFINLINNAIEANATKILLSNPLPNCKQQFVVAVGDNGDGIPEPELSKIFLPLYSKRVKKSNNCKGHGIGLWLTREFIRKMGGQIEVESRVNIGSEFRVTLPTSSA